MSMFERIMPRACEDCVFGVSDSATSDMAARTSAGRLVEVWVISSSKLPARNCINFILSKAAAALLSERWTRAPSGATALPLACGGAVRSMKLHQGRVEGLVTARDCEFLPAARIRHLGAPPAA